MNEPPPTFPRDRTGRAAMRFDEACDRFEAEWRRGRRPRIEDALREAEAPDRAPLLLELLQIELELRRRGGEAPRRDDYRGRFPDDFPSIAAAFAAAASRRAETGPTLAVQAAPPHAAADGTPAARRASVPGASRFRVLRRHARGGLGEVFVAYDEELHREVALKEIRRDRADDGRGRARFVLEAEITGSLEHPGIVPVYGLGEFGDGRPFYAMRFVQGDSLKAAIERFHAADAPDRDPGERALALRGLLRRFVDVCNAIAYAHSRGVLHRDIKPANIMLGKYGETLVVDWGLAKAVGAAESDGGPAAEPALRPASASGSTPTVAGDAPGTPAYMSPEQAAGAPEGIGPWSDIYSLGATLYCLLTGRAPIADVADDAEDGPGRVRSGAIAPPRQVHVAIPPALEAICLKAMAVAPEGRYASARALADDVERWLADEPVTAWREPATIRARRWARRHRTPVAAMLVALAAGAIGLGAVAGVEARANRDLEQAGAARQLALDEARASAKAAEAALAQAKRSQAETRAALAQSEESRRQAEAVSRFLVEAFRSPDPSVNGRNVKVVEILARAGDRLDKEFDGSPATRGALLDALGETYRGLGQPGTAASLHARALAVRESELGPDHPDAIRSRERLGVACCEAGRLKEAVALHEATLRRREATLGPDHPETLATRNNLASAYWSSGRRNEALSLTEATLKRQEARFGPDHPNTLSTRLNLAVSYEAAGRRAEAIALNESALGPLQARLGPDREHTILCRLNLAGCYWMAGRLAEAMAMAEKSRELSERRLGRDHPVTLSATNDLAVYYAAAGRRSEAIPLYEATLERQEATSQFRISFTHRTRQNLAGAYQSLGRWAEAERLHRRVLESRRETDDPDSLDLAEDLVALGRNLMGQARWIEAAPLLGEALAIREQVTPDDWSLYDDMSMLGGILLGQGRHAEAEPLIVGGYEGMKARETYITPTERHRLGEAGERIARLYEAWGKPDLAATWKARLGIPDLPSEVFAQP